MLVAVAIGVTMPESVFATYAVPVPVELHGSREPATGARAEACAGTTEPSRQHDQRDRHDPRPEHYPPNRAHSSRHRLLPPAQPLVARQHYYSQYRLNTLCETPVVKKSAHTVQLSNAVPHRVIVRRTRRVPLGRSDAVSYGHSGVSLDTRRPAARQVRTASNPQ